MEIKANECLDYLGKQCRNISVLMEGDSTYPIDPGLHQVLWFPPTSQRHTGLPL